MLVVETIAKVRRAHFVQGKAIKAICRELSVSRKVVRKLLRAEATEFRYEREAQPPPRLGRWVEDLERLLSVNAAKPGREQTTGADGFEAAIRTTARSAVGRPASGRYERRRLPVTSNRPFGEWNNVFPDTAMTLAAVDRLVHHAVIIGEDGGRHPNTAEDR